jgi:phage-related protein
MAAESAPRKRWRFYRTDDGREIVRDELEALPRDARATLAEALKRRERGQQLRREEEHVRGRVHAVRVTVDGQEYRALYATVAPHDEILLAVRVLAKTTRKLPKQEIDLAFQRLRTWEERSG